MLGIKEENNYELTEKELKIIYNVFEKDFVLKKLSKATLLTQLE